MSFRLDRKRFALTYPQCDRTCHYLLNHLRKLCPEFEYIITCQENHHQTDGQHLHALLISKHRINVRRADYFDLFPGPDDSFLQPFHCHIEEVRSVKDWINYCKKDGVWLDDGTNPIQEQKRTKEEYNKLIMNENLDNLVDQGVINIKELPKLIAAKESYKILKSNERTEPPKVFWYYGATGTGKTRLAIDNCKGFEYWISGDDLRWFDGYCGQSKVIFDDLRADSCKWSFLLRLLDRYKLYVPIKGGFANWIPTEIYITAPSLPEDLFINHASGRTWDKIDQLKRRITEYRDFDVNPYNGPSSPTISEIPQEISSIPAPSMSPRTENCESEIQSAIHKQRKLLIEEELNRLKQSRVHQGEEDVPLILSEEQKELAEAVKNIDMKGDLHSEDDEDKVWASFVQRTLL